MPGQKVSIKKGAIYLGALVEYRNHGEMETVQRNLKSFRKGFEKSYGKDRSIAYINCMEHDEFKKRYGKASSEDRIKSYSFKSGSMLYVDMKCLENCSEEEAYMMGLSSAVTEIMAQY